MIIALLALFFFSVPVDPVMPNDVPICQNYPGADAGAKLAACIHAAKDGGTVDARGFTGAQVISSTVQVGRPGAPVHLICNRAATFIFHGTGPALLIPEGADHSEIEGCSIDLQESKKDGIGIEVEGAWFSQIKDVRIQNAPVAGIYISDDGPTGRGTYLLSVQDTRLEAGNYRGVWVRSIKHGGVTYTQFRNTYAYGNHFGFVLEGGTAPSQVSGTGFLGGGANGSAEAGIALIGRVFNTNIGQGFDIEQNKGWGITNTEVADGVFMTGVSFDHNGSGTYQTNAKRIIDWGPARRPRFYSYEPNQPFSFVGPSPLRVENNGSAEFRVLSTDEGGAAVGLGAEPANSGFLWSLTDRKNNERVLTQGSAPPRDLIFSKPVKFSLGVDPSGGGLKHERVPTGIIAAGARRQVRLAWKGAFKDTAYTANCDVEDPGGNLEKSSIISTTPEGLTVLVRNLDQSATHQGTLNCIAVHD